MTVMLQTFKHAVFLIAQACGTHVCIYYKLCTIIDRLWCMAYNTKLRSIVPYFCIVQCVVLRQFGQQLKGTVLVQVVLSCTAGREPGHRQGA